MGHPLGNCPICKKEFQAGDDIVICPDCGAPYHRTCYKKEGACLFGAQHGSGFEYAPAGARPQPAPTTSDPAPGDEAAPPPRTGYDYSAGSTHNATGGNPASGSTGETRGIVCPACGTINSGVAIFCEKCGAPLHQQAQGRAQGGGAAFFGGAQAPPFQPATEFDGVSTREWATYIGPSAEVYLTRFAALDRQKTAPVFTLSAFLLGPFYFAYRKLWGWALVAFLIMILTSMPQMVALYIEAGVSFATSIPEQTLYILNNIAFLLKFASNIFFGFAAVRLYRRQGAKKLQALRGETADPQHFANIARMGGTSALGVFAVCMLTFAVSLGFIYLGGAPLLDYAAQYYGLSTDALSL